MVQAHPPVVTLTGRQYPPLKGLAGAWVVWCSLIVVILYDDLLQQVVTLGVNAGAYPPHIEHFASLVMPAWFYQVAGIKRYSAFYIYSIRHTLSLRLWHLAAFAAES